MKLVALFLLCIVASAHGMRVDGGVGVGVYSAAPSSILDDTSDDGIDLVGVDLGLLAGSSPTSVVIPAGGFSLGDRLASCRRETAAVCAAVHMASHAELDALWATPCTPEDDMSAEAYLDAWYEARGHVKQARRFLIKFRLIFSAWYATHEKIDPVELKNFQACYARLRARYDIILAAAVRLRLGTIGYKFNERWPGNAQYPTDFRPLGFLASGTCDACGATLVGEPSCPNDACATTYLLPKKGDAATFIDFSRGVMWLIDQAQGCCKDFETLCKELQ